MPSGNDFADWQAVAAVTHGDLRHKAQMAGDEPVRGLTVGMFRIALGEHVLFLRFQHRELADLVQITIEAGFSGSNGR